MGRGRDKGRERERDRKEEDRGGVGQGKDGRVGTEGRERGGKGERKGKGRENLAPTVISKSRHLCLTLLVGQHEEHLVCNRVALDFSSGKSEIRPFFPNPAKSGSGPGQICSQIWQMPVQLQSCSAFS